MKRKPQSVQTSRYFSKAVSGGLGEGVGVLKFVIALARPRHQTGEEHERQGRQHV